MLLAFIYILNQVHFAKKNKKIGFNLTCIIMGLSDIFTLHERFVLVLKNVVGA
jgi:hypothetical protein